MTEAKAIGERGWTEYTINCVICDAKIHLSGYFLRDFQGFPLNKQGQRYDFLFPDGTSKQGIICNNCRDCLRSKMNLSSDGDNKWIWK